MNQDQVFNLIQKLIVLAAGGLIAKGIGDSSVWEDVGGAVAALVTWYISHQWNATTPTPPPQPPSPPTPPMSLGGALHLAMIVALTFSLCVGLELGCVKPPRTAYVTAGSVQVSVETAMAAWNIYVGQFHPPLATELKVKAAYQKYQQAMTVVCDAGAVYASAGVTNSAGLTGASAALSTAQANAAQSLSDLVALLRTLGVKI